MGKMFEERKAALRKAGQWIGYTKYIRFTWGNTYKQVQANNRCVH